MTRRLIRLFVNKKYCILTYSLILLALYVIGLINPFTGPALQYPYYEAFCGKKPVIGTSFMEGQYFVTSDMEGYSTPGLYDTLYCTENDARSQGYSKSL
jgi:hypothetical protein